MIFLKITTAINHDFPNISNIFLRLNMQMHLVQYL